jgi:hypothetical protein
VKLPSVEDVIVWGAVLIVCLMMLYLMLGCSAKQSKYQVSYTKGCHIEVKAVENEKASQMVEEIRFGDCTVGTDEESNSKPKEKQE